MGWWIGRLRLELFLLGLEDFELVLEGGLEGRAVEVKVGPGEREGGETGGVRLEVVEGLPEVLFLRVDEFQSRRDCLYRRHF